ncbi:ATP-binding protein [Streptomyces sp. NPDC048172]|uniref:ATP-binding protein n=1 Tax=Streptomyces sp. NPDC048172 TaxID=3365505 RepID=UPI0037245DDD
MPVDRPVTPPQHAACGYYLISQEDGFVLHMSCSHERLSALRSLVIKTVTGAGVGDTVADCAELVTSELVGNAVRACGPWAPVVVRLAVDGGAVLVEVHDPDRAALPARGATAPDDATSESGRGLWILDSLAPGWTVRLTSLGKRIACRLPYAAGHPGVRPVAP